MAGTKDIFTFVAADEAATLRCAAWLAQHMPAAGPVFLSGDLGAGKTAFARGFIRAVHGQDTIVPSPTFTLVQPYDGAPAVLHADLYRLAAPEEIDELGLIDALADHICLIEWAEKAEGLLPPALVTVALTMAEEHGEAARRIDIKGPPELLAGLAALAKRDAALDRFLSDTAWADAPRVPLAGDASTRRYERVGQDGRTAVLMDWQAMPDGPPVYDGKSYSRLAHLAEAMPRFADMVDWLVEHDCPAPRLYAVDRANGFALLQDFGDRIITKDAHIDRTVFYHEAVENLLHLHGCSPPAFLPAYDGAVQAVETSLFTDWYLPYRKRTISPTAKTEWRDIWQKLGDDLLADTLGGTPLSGQAPVTVLRDYHSVNLIWRDDAQGRYRVGLIDVQDALKGHAAYDLASLIYDARIDVSAAHRAHMLAHYLERRFAGDVAARQAFEAALAVCAVQRNLKIAGIFIRLAIRDHKPAYLAHMPRVLDDLKTHIDHPALAEVAQWLAHYAPDALVMTDD